MIFSLGETDRAEAREQNTVAAAAPTPAALERDKNSRRLNWVMMSVPVLNSLFQTLPT
jgi:hypothetical protein